MRRRTSACLLACLLLALPLQATAEAPGLSAAGAALVDVQTGRLLAGQNAHIRLPMASTTKVMTALLAIEHGGMEEMVTTPAEAYGVEGSSIYLHQDEALSLRDLLYGLMLSSGNDAAVTIAMHIAGSVEAFAALMNAKAKELGCTNTHFVTPNGLHNSEHYTSAYDLARIAAAAMREPLFREIVGTQYHTTVTGDMPRTFKNKNKILWQVPGGNGVKTGFTKAAGRCLVFSAEREEHTLVGVVLNAPDMWNDAKSYLEYGFSEYTWERLVTAGEIIKTIPAGHGMKNTLDVLAKEDILVPVRAGEEKPALRVVCLPNVEAPVSAGQVLGSAEVWYDNVCLQKTELVAAETIYRKDYAYYLHAVVEQWCA
ncbi:MAG: D-alanyl-D-alanine carboxypeptidase [Eubacteriales bacterium]|nr:D-alanyl-D-alanine carboxypeptidase [Eubacteriales bacterium]